MREHRRFIGKGILFCLLVGMLVLQVNRILIPKFFYTNSWPTTTAYLGFYEMERNSVDVLFFGSSHAVNGFNPQELYNQYGITSYNLGCEQQNLVLSYYWLKEALRYQTPKVVVLDGYILFPYNRNEPLNSAEACSRKALDFMRWSSVKKEAIDTICEIDKKQTVLSYYLPNIRYHTRWMGLSEDDFTFEEMEKHYELKGYSALTYSYNQEGYQPLIKGSTEEHTEMVELMREYLDKIRVLCEEHGIQLVLVKTPAMSQDIGKYNTMQAYASEHQLLFYDFNEQALYQEIGYQFAMDNADSGHGNLWGAKKVTSYLGKILTENCGIEGKIHTDWENSRAYYEQVQKDVALTKETNIYPYLSMLDDPEYVVFIAAKDEASNSIDEKLVEEFERLGLKASLKGQYRSSYLAVVTPEGVKEEVGYDKLEDKGMIRDGRVAYWLQSGGYDNGNMCSIKVSGQEYAKGLRGLNIVVYSLVQKKVIDAVCFDTCDAGCKAFR